MITFRFHVSGVEAAVRKLDAKAERCRDMSGAFVEAGFLLITRIWDRITGKPTSPPTYTDQYVRWLIKTGDWSGKMVGILSGGLIAQTVPVQGSQPAGELEARSGPDFVEVGFLNPSPKARGFLSWFSRRFGEEAIQATEDDERDVVKIFDNWMAERA